MLPSSPWTEHIHEFKNCVIISLKNSQHYLLVSCFDYMPPDYYTVNMTICHRMQGQKQVDPTLPPTFISWNQLQCLMESHFIFFYLPRITEKWGLNIELMWNQIHLSRWPICPPQVTITSPSNGLTISLLKSQTMQSSWIIPCLGKKIIPSIGRHIFVIVTYYFEKIWEFSQMNLYLPLATLISVDG